MMHGTLQRKKDPFAGDALAREPWMDMPLRDMTAAQRQRFKEFERKVAEVAEAREAARRAAEVERRGVEEEAMGAVAAFNEALAALRLEKMAAEAAIATAEQQQLALAAALQHVRVAHAAPLRKSWDLWSVLAIDARAHRIHTPLALGCHAKQQWSAYVAH
jgi:hypothetical protein